MAVRRPAIERPLPVPKVILEGGRRGWITASIAGGVLGAVSLIVPAFLSDSDAFAFFAVFLGMIAGVYLGFALNDGRAVSFQIEYLGIVIHGALAVVAVVTGEPLYLVAGYLGHALWDGLHPGAVHTTMPLWYSPLCIGFDVVLGVYIFVRFV